MFKPIFTTVVLATSIVLVKSVDVCAWSNTIACSGSAVCCNNLGANVCCDIATQGFGYSISYDGLLAPVSAGQAWQSNNCGAGAIDVAQVGTGNKCWVGGGSVVAGSMAWTHAASRRSAIAKRNGECSTPDTLRFTVNGVAKAIKIPADAGAVDVVVGLLNAGNFTALEAYPPAE